jgi:hypothetical protein
MPLCYNGFLMIRKLLSVVFAVVVFNLLFFSGSPQMQGEPQVFDFGTIWFLLLTCAGHIFLWIAFLELPLSRRQAFALKSSGLAIFLVFLPLFRASFVDRSVLGLMSLAFSAISLYLFGLTHQKFGAITEIFAVPIRLTFGWFESWIKFLETSPTLIDKFRKNILQRGPKVSLSESHAVSLVRGAVITVPIIGVLFLLLTSADPIFSKQVSSLFNLPLISLPELSPRILLTLFFIGAAAPFAWLTLQSPYQSPFQNKFWRGYRFEAMMVVGAVAALLGTFLLVQFRYLFATVTERELHQFGVATYSEYVRKGFGELLLVSIIVYIVSGLSMVIYRNLTKEESKWLGIFNFVLLSETFVFIFSIARRVILYQSTHGLSRVRIYGMSFLVLLLVLTGILVLRHIRTKSYQWYLYEISALVLVVVATLLFNPDQMISTVFKPTVNDEVDYTYIARLSADAVDGWAEAYSHTKQYILKPEFIGRTEFTDIEARHLIYAKQVLGSLRAHRTQMAARYQPYIEKQTFSWRSPQVQGFNFAEYAAYQKAQNTIFTPELDALEAKVDAYLAVVNAKSGTNSVPLDRSSRTPLVR